MADTKVYAGKEGIQELWRRIKAEIGKFTSFQKKPAAPDGTPDVPVAYRKTNIIYLVEDSTAPSPDHYKEWIWTLPGGSSGEWVCIGDTTTEVDTELNPESGNPLANSAVTAEVTRLDGRVDTEHTYASSEVARLDTRIDDLYLVLTDVEGTVSGTTMTVFVDNGTYTRFNVPATVETLVVTTAEKAITGNVSRSMFEFTLPEDAVLNSMRVINAQDIDCLSTAPMTWPGGVTYQGTVTNGIATVIGHAPMLYNKEWISTSDGNLLTTSSGQKLKYVFKT